MKRGLLAVGVLWLALAGAPAGAAIKAYVDNSQVAPGQTIQLTLQRDGQTDSQPDLSPLEKDFDVLGESTSSNIRIINGQVSSGTELDITLSPKRSGKLTIPSISWGADQSPPLTVNVAPGAGGGQGAKGTVPSSVFLTTDVEPKQPYVLAAVHLTVRVYAAATLYRPSLDFSSSHDVLVQQIGDDQNSTVEKNGESYSVVTRHYLLFPQHSGHITIDGPTLSAEVASSSRSANDPFSSFFGGPFGLTTTQPIEVHGDPIVLNVQPRPASATAAPYWLPARSVTLQADWQPHNLRANTGDPVTVNLKLQAVDLAAAQLPDLSSLLSLPPGLKVYPEQAKLTDTAQGGTVEGTRDQTIALIADQPGHYTFPSLHLTWWDTRANRPRQVTLPARTLVITPAPGSPAPAVPAPAVPVTRPAAPQAVHAQPASSSPWQWVSLGLGVLWLGTVGGWILSRRNPTPPLPRPKEPSLPPLTPASHARSAFLAACRNDDAPAARRHLLAWATATWGSTPSGLSAIATRLDDLEIAALLRELDRACFAEDRTWSGAALAAALTALPGPKGATPSGRSSRLAPLYH